MPVCQDELRRKWSEEWNRILALTISAARDEATELLLDQDAFHTIEKPPAGGRFDDWAPELRSVLNRYELINSRIGAARLARASIRPSAVDCGLTEIGQNEDAFVAVRPQEEIVYELDAQGKTPPWLAAPLPSIWHWLLWTHYINLADPTSRPFADE